MKKLIILTSFALFSVLAMAQTAYRDVVYLKNGSIIKGTIVEQIIGVSLKIETADGSIFVFAMEDVEKIVKEKIEQPAAAVAPKENKVEVKVKADEYYVKSVPIKDVEKEICQKNFAINGGFMMGGGSLVGVDLEGVIPNSIIGVQGGVGINSFGLGLNFHFIPNNINSSFLSLAYFHQGFGNNHYAAYLGPMVRFRFLKCLQAGIGYGIVVSKGNAIYNTKYSDMTSSLLFDVGVYFTF